MKKISAILASFCLTALCGLAQTMDDVKSLVQSDYYGTARTIGMGNAVSALGGDLGTVVFNPAGAAVASYSQASITPGISVAFNTAQMTNMESSGPARTTSTRFVLPNFGVNIVVNGTNDVFRRFTFGFSATSTHIYNDRLTSNAAGSASIAGSMAYNSQGFTEAELGNYSADYACCVGYNSYAISSEDFQPENCYSAITENYDPVMNRMEPVRTSQRYNRGMLGTKTDYMINMGIDLGDYVYAGATLGFTVISQQIDEQLSEYAIDGIVYDTSFKNLGYSYDYNCRGNGVYGKFGIIATPVAGLRIGAAVQTPTAMDITEFWGHKMQNAWYRDHSRDITVSKTASSPDGEWRYKVSLPFRYNFGLAYTIGKAVVLSADYERADYKLTRYKPVSRQDDFSEFNAQISGINEGRCMTSANIVRAGVEIRPAEWLRVRAGYNFSTCGEGVSEGLGRVTGLRNDSHSVSGGLGFYTSESFFADLALRYAWRENFNMERIYSDYSCWAETDKERIPVTAPGAFAARQMLTIVATIGWRF